MKAIKTKHLSVMMRQLGHTRVCMRCIVKRQMMTIGVHLSHTKVEDLTKEEKIEAINEIGKRIAEDPYGCRCGKHVVKRRKRLQLLRLWLPFAKTITLYEFLEKSDESQKTTQAILGEVSP